MRPNLLKTEETTDGGNTLDPALNQTILHILALAMLCVL